MSVTARRRLKHRLPAAMALLLVAAMGAPMVSLGAEPSGSPSPSAGTSESPPPSEVPLLEVTVTALATIAHLGHAYPVAIQVTNASTVAVTAIISAGHPGHLELTTDCLENQIRLEPAATFVLDCDLPIPDYVSCDITWLWFEVSGTSDAGVWAETDAGLARLAIDIEEVPAYCPADPRPEITLQATSDGPPLEVGGTSDGSVQFENTGNITLSVMTIQFRADGPDVSDGSCDVFTVLRPGEIATGSCVYSLREPVDCDLVFRPAYAEVRFNFYKGDGEFVDANGDPVDVDVAGVERCGAGSTSPPAAPTVPPTDATTQIPPDHDGGVGLAFVVSVLFGIAALGFAAVRRRGSLAGRAC